MTFTFLKNYKTLSLLASIITLGGCASISFNNIPNVNPSLKYLTLSSSNNKVLLQTYNQLTKDGYIIISSSSSSVELQQAIDQIKAYRSQLQITKTSNNNLSNKVSTDTTDNIELPKDNKFQTDSNLNTDESIITSSKFDSPTDVAVEKNKILNHSSNTPTDFTILSLPTEDIAQSLPKANKLDEIVDISQCQDSFLTFSCVSKFLPNLKIDSYSTITKNLSLFSSGSYAQRTVIANLNGVLTIPKLGSIALYTLNSDLQFTNGATQLGNVVKNKTFDQLNLSNAVITLVNRVEFILQTQTYKLNH